MGVYDHTNQAHLPQGALYLQNLMHSVWPKGKYACNRNPSWAALLTGLLWVVINRHFICSFSLKRDGWSKIYADVCSLIVINLEPGESESIPHGPPSGCLVLPGGKRPSPGWKSVWTELNIWKLGTSGGINVFEDWTPTALSTFFYRDGWGEEGEKKR